MESTTLETTMASTTHPITELERVVVAYPCGNTAAVIFDEIHEDDYKDLNDRILATWSAQQPTAPKIEQCCLVTKPQDARAVTRVEMLGGEFSANAVRCVALIVAGDKAKGLIEASGAPRPLEYQVKDGVVTLEIPLPENKPLVRKTDDGALVQLDGITQLVVTDPMLQVSHTPREVLTKLLRENKFSVTAQPCVGATYYDEASHKSEFCVWIKDVETIFDQSSSGSGTSAIGIALAMKSGKSVKIKVVQPSGQVMTTETKFVPKHIVRSSISGKITILYDGKLKLL